MSYKIEESQYFCTNMPTIFHNHIIYSITDINGIITNVSNAFCLETGYQRKDIIGKTHSFLRAPNFPDEIYKDLWDTITKDNIWKGQINNLRKDGISYWTNSIIQPIFDEKNKKIAYLAIRQNITREKE
ncbi:MAG: hypothetical protein COB17_01720 [Sulfurimonas sp.]|nr:MAG: hypothetical protein COB17_01720 [Sulfurimonas sp.]